MLFISQNFGEINIDYFRILQENPNEIIDKEIENENKLIKSGLRLKKEDGFSVEYAEQKSIKPNTPLIDDRFARDEWGWRPQFNSLELIVDRFKLDFVQPN